MAKSVSVALGESDTTQLGFADASATPAVMRGRASALKKSARANRRDLNMDISFPSKWFGRRMDIRTTAPYLESCLSHLLAEGDLATWSKCTTTYSCGTALESHQLRCREAPSTILHPRLGPTKSSLDTTYRGLMDGTPKRSVGDTIGQLVVIAILIGILIGAVVLLRDYVDSHNSGTPTSTRATFSFNCCTGFNPNAVYRPGEIVHLSWTPVEASSATYATRTITLTAKIKKKEQI